jgi:signal transduction histidine kinase
VSLASGAGHPPLCAGPAVRRLFGCNLREGLASLAVVALPAAATWFQQRHAWLGLFGAILLPILFASLALLAAQALLGPYFGWPAAWLVLLAGLVAGAALGFAAYQHWMAALQLRPMADARLLASSFGVAALATGVPLWRAQGQARAQHLADLRQAALVAEMKALQAQVEPHFLYNTLANTRYLARRDPDKAAEMLEHLIAYLHGALPDMRASSSTLGRECELADHYLALMAIRFGDRLHYRVDCAPELAEVAMPPLMLMTLVENAVKHGLEPQPGPVSITLAASRQDGALHLTVADDGAGLAAAKQGEGVGLRNLRERLAAYGPAARFTLSRSAAGVTEARLVLPDAPIGFEQ